MAEETLEQMKARQAARRKATMAKMGAVIGANERQIEKKQPKKPSKAVQAAKNKLKGTPAPGGSLNPKNRTNAIDDASGFGKKK